MNYKIIIMIIDTMTSGLTIIKDGYVSTPYGYIKADIITGNAVVLHSLPTSIFSFSDIGYYKTAFLIHHGSWELLAPSVPGVLHSGGWGSNGTRQSQVIFKDVDIDVRVLVGKYLW